MNLDQLNQKLIAAARRNAPSDQVPYSFEKRILARLVAAPVTDSLALWARAFWRAAVPCVAVVVLLGLCSFLLPVEKPLSTAVASSASITELSQDFENTLLAAVDQPANATEDF